MKRYHWISFTAFILLLSLTSRVHAQAIVDGQPSVLREDKGQSNYVYDLKLLIKKSKDNIKTVNDKIKEQAIIKRNQQREQKAREYYEQALKLQEEGRLEEARQLFDKAIRITEHPEMKYYIKESERRSKLQEVALERLEADQDRRLSEDEKLLMERADSSYAIAVSLYKQQKFREAKDEFLLVEEMYPDYKAVRSYLQILEQDIIQSEQLGLKEQRKEIERQQKEEEIARLREKELWRKEIDKKEKERTEQLRQQAQKVYEEAVRLYEERKYMAAREKFQEVEWVVPDFKATRAYMTRIENDVQDEKKQISIERQRELEKQRWQEVLDQKKVEEDRRKAIELREQERLLQVKEQAEFVYQAAVALFEKDLFAQAKDRFEEVEGIYPDYKTTRNYLKRIDQAAREAEEREALKRKLEQERQGWEEELARRKEEKEKFKQTISEADDLYENALRLYQTSRLIEAKEKFLEVDTRIPDYKSTRSYLKRIDQDIELLVKTQRSQETIAEQRKELEQMRIMREKAEAVYAQALAAYDIKDFVLAKSKFKEVDSIFPDLKKTGYYLNRIDEDIRLNEEMKARLAKEKEADLAYAQALAFYQAGQFEEAKKKFVEVESILPNYKQTPDYLERVDDDILRKKTAELERAKEDQVRGVYNQAKALYDNGALSEAKEKFLQVEVIYPGYKETTRILGVIDVQIESQQRELAQRKRMEEADKLYAQAMALYAAGDFVGAKDKFIKVEVVVPDYKETPRYLARIDGDIARKKRDEEMKIKAQEAEPLYAQGAALYKETEFIEARKKFIQVHAVFPGYKDVAVYLARIEKDIRDQEERVALEEKRRKAEALYGEAVQLYVNRKFVEAKTKFFELTGVDPAYKNVKTYLSRIDNDIREEANRQAMERIEQQASEPYAQAVTLYHDGDFEGAKAKFLEVTKISPDYKKTKTYLANVDRDIRAKKDAEEKERLTKAEILYKDAVMFMSAGKKTEALDKFNQVELVYPDYKATRANIEKLGKITPRKIEQTAVSAAPPVEVLPSEQQIVAVYKEAVALFKEKKYDQAKGRFEEVLRMKPGYRSTQEYLDSIEGIQRTSVRQTLQQKPENKQIKTPVDQQEFSAQRTVETKALIKSKPDPESKVKEKARLVDEPTVQRLEEAKKIEKKAADQPEAARSSADAGSVEIKSRTLVETDSAKRLESLAARSNAIYEQIKGLSDDDEMAGTAKTFAKVDRVIETLEAEHRRIANELERQKKAEEKAALRAKQQEREEAERSAKVAIAQAESLKRREQGKAQEAVEAQQAALMKERSARRKKEREELERLKDERREVQLKTEILYQQAQGFMRKKNYEAAKERLLDIEKISSGYKDVTSLLISVERAQDQARLDEQEVSEREVIRGLAEKATALNMEILALSQQKEYEAVEKRFGDLESILKEIQIIKSRMLQRRDEFTLRWENKAQDSKAKKNDQLALKGAKDIEYASLREKAEVIFKEGQQLYALEKFAEARVKFIEALHVDPTYKAAMSYVNRLDRILAKRDFEAKQQKDSDQLQLNDPALSPAVPVTDPKRALQVSGEGRDLYKARRYREAKIKFEELLQVGEEADQRQAKRYLTLIDQELAKEQRKIQADQQAEKERFLEERRARAKLQWKRDKHEQERERRKIEEMAAQQRELDIRRQQELRAIERENYSQRRNMIELENREFAKAAAEARQEHANFLQEPKKQESSLEGAQAAEEKSRKEKQQAQEAMQAPVAPTTDAVIVQESEQEIREFPGTNDTRVLEQKTVQELRVSAKTEKQRRRLDQLESREERIMNARLREEKKKIKKIEQAEARERKAVEDKIKAQRVAANAGVDKKAEKPPVATEEQQKMTADQRQQEMIRRNQEEVEAILKEDVMTKPLAQQPAPDPLLTTEEEPAFILLKQAAEEEKHRLEEQRLAIRKDFENGVERLYNNAVMLFKKKIYAEARQDFEQVDALIKGYKKTEYYLKKIAGLLSKE